MRLVLLFCVGDAIAQGVLGFIKKQLIKPEGSGIGKKRRCRRTQSKKHLKAWQKSVVLQKVLSSKSRASKEGRLVKEDLATLIGFFNAIKTER